ncbi:MAG: hypothetical protein ACRECW_18615 [Phyllobacterium sp.]
MPSTVERIALGAGVLKHLAVASLWRGNTLQGIRGDCRSRAIRISTEGQQLVQRIDDWQGNPEFCPYDPEENAPPYLRLAVLNDQHVRNAFVRCSELIRFYFGQVSVISSRLFDFDDSCANPHLYNTAATGWRSDGLFAIAPSDEISSNDAAFLAVLLASTPSRRSLAMAARSARVAMHNNRPVWPAVYAPVEGEVIWEIIGPRFPFEDKTSETEREGEVIGISQIVRCHAPVSVRQIEILRSGSHSKAEQHAPSKLFLAGGDTISGKPPVRSDEPPDFSTGSIVDVGDTLANLRPATAAIDTRVNYKAIRDNDLMLIPKGDPSDATSVSTVDGTAGSLDIGSYETTVSVPATVDAADKLTDDQEIDRSLLPELFSDYPDDLPGIVVTPLVDVPSIFRNLVEGRRLFSANFSEPVDIGFLGERTGTSFADAIPLLQLPSEWGQFVKCERSPTGYRRALVLRIFTDTWQCLFFDIERRTDTEPIGIHCMLFPSSRPLPMPVVARIIRSRLSGESWPSRHTHSGAFFAESMRHSFKPPIANRSAGLLFKHLWKLRTEFRAAAAAS